MTTRSRDRETTTGPSAQAPAADTVGHAAHDVAAPSAAHSRTRRKASVPFEDFVAARSGALLRTAYLLTHDHALAEDLLQTALAKAWPAWDRIDEPEAYLRRVLVTTFSSWWRRKWNGETPTEVLPETSAPDAHDAAGTRDDLWSAMARLPRRQRAVVVLRYLEDLTEAQTAEALGCSVGTVKSQTSKAFAKLRIDPSLTDHHPTTTTSEQTGEELS
ncbi:SigE family RNA polymerase sigma factor [Nocardioides bruguierae]|uniref:SigE family RNA polymerase sigma factor n=1 Tax=Nocardioides bruguierae TaxID=2945102 RepID=A0A9X2IFC4_9ACTN|nr:SigE family RNA polymerase sigma factor [Nocardioides bruguierae]MCM0620274.1 SigE family RNA polymerase sigma factor [Nocardioides bruguierae]